MLSLSQTTGYAIKALGCLNEPTCDSRSTPEIAACARVPKPYLAKIVHALARRGLVTARRGVGGGVSLAHPPHQITLLRIVEAVEGPDWLGECLLGLDECSDQRTCPTHAFWQRIREEIRRELAGTTLADVIQFKRAGRRPATRPPGRTSRKASSTANHRQP